MLKYLIITMLFSIVLFSAECDKRVFTTLSANNQTSIAQMIDRLSEFCSFSIIVKDSDAGMELQKKLSTTNLRNFTLNDAFEHLLGENGFSYTFLNNTLIIKYTITKTFKVDYIATSRKGQSNISLSGQSASNSNSSSTQSSQQSPQNSSTTTIQMTDDFKFWGQIEQEIRQIVDSKNPKPLEQIQSMRQIGTTASEAELNSIVPGANIAQLVAEFGQNPNRASTQPKQIQQTQISNKIPYTNVIVNKEAGLITITANKDIIKEVGEYLNIVMDRLHKQVFIDVHILQVELSNSSKEGINWEQLMSAGGTLSYNLQSAGAPGVGNFVQFAGSLSLSRILGFLNTQGNVKAISNPKAMTLNNQPAMIFSGRIVYYPNVSGGTSGTATSGATNPNVTATPLQVGVALDITPEVQDNDEIMLKINPSISACETRSCALQQINVAGQSYSMAPNLAQQQLASLVRVRNGEKVILGGLIKKDNEINDAGLPLLSSIPLLGRLFSENNSQNVTSELVIIITPYVNKTSVKPPTLKELGYGSDIQESTNEK